MLDEMSTEQFFAWRAYYMLEPFGERRRDLRSGILTALTANVNRDPKKHPKPFEPSDFFTSLQSTSKKKSGARKPLMAGEEWQSARKLLTVNYGG